MQVHVAFGSAPTWTKSLYTGGGPSGPIAALTLLHNFVAWLQLRIPNLHNIDLHVYSPAEIALGQVSTTAWKLTHVGGSNPNHSLCTAAPPASRGHLTLSCHKSQLADVFLRLTGNTFPLKSLKECMDELEIEGTNTTDGYVRTTRPLHVSNDSDLKLMGAIRSIVAETFHVLLIASDVAPAHATTFRGYFPEPEAAG